MSEHKSQLALGDPRGEGTAANLPRERRAPFVQALPDDPALRPLIEAFERGDFAEVRKLAPALERSRDPDVRRAASNLLARTRPDALLLLLLAVSVGLFGFLTAWAYGGG
jgi:hypothetical protein